MHIEHWRWIWYLIRGDWYYGVNVLDYLGNSLIDMGVVLGAWFFGAKIELPWRAHGRRTGRVVG
jgi:hypothetical protein